MCGGLTFDDVLTILQSLEPTNEPLFVRVDGVRHALIVDKVVEIKRDDLSYSLGSPASREIYLHARLQVSSQPGGSLREQLDRMINKTGRGS